MSTEHTLTKNLYVSAYRALGVNVYEDGMKTYQTNTGSSDGSFYLYGKWCVVVCVCQWWKRHDIVGKSTANRHKQTTTQIHWHWRRRQYERTCIIQSHMVAFAHIPTHTQSHVSTHVHIYMAIRFGSKVTTTYNQHREFSHTNREKIYCFGIWKHSHWRLVQFGPLGSEPNKI